MAVLDRDRLPSGIILTAPQYLQDVLYLTAAPGPIGPGTSRIPGFFPELEIGHSADALYTLTPDTK